jgi:hypothetical protein
MRLFHFSEDPSITVFEPRLVSVATARASGQSWLNGPLVWAIEERFQAMYLFPRDCPRIVVFRKADSSLSDVEHWFGTRDCVAIAHIEWDWFERLAATTLYRYDLPTVTFEDLNDAGMHVSRTSVRPVGVTALSRPLDILRDAGVELRIMRRLTPLRRAWDTSLHVSGIRLRNAQDW